MKRVLQGHRINIWHDNYEYSISKVYWKLADILQRLCSVRLRQQGIIVKILMVCTYPHGGATIAARRQAQALSSIGQDCSLVSIREDGDASEISVTEDNREISLIVPASAWSYSGRITTAYCNDNRTDISNTWFSFWPCDSFLDDVLLKICLNFDVIHFHWIAQMVSSRLLSKLRSHKRRIVITGHDMNHFTGGCHYSAGCNCYQSACAACPQLLVDPLKLVANSFHQKILAFSALPATWLFPSEWLAGSFQTSLLNNNPAACKVLYNCIDMERFYYLPMEARNNERRMFGFAPQEMVFVAGAADNTELRKGFDYITSGIQYLTQTFAAQQASNRHCVIVTFGQGTPRIETHSPFIRHVHLGVITEDEVITLLQAADLLVFPSVEENFSNTILESLMCGCPVLAFRIGGVPDIVTNETNGWIVDSVSHQDFSSTLAAISDPGRLEAMRFSTQQWRDQCAGRYCYEQIAGELMNVYQSTSDVTRPRIVGVMVDDDSSQYHYAELFKSVFANDTFSQTMLATNLANHVALVKDTNYPQEPNKADLIIPAIYTGFTDMTHYEPVGRVAWLLKDASVFFRPPLNSRPALLVGVPNIDWVASAIDKTLTTLTATLNGKKLEVYCVKPQMGGKFLYIWVMVQPDAVITDVYNTIILRFSESSLPDSKDVRGMCILHCHVTLFDLGFISPNLGVSGVPDYPMCSALALKATQNHYLWPGWDADKNSKAALQNDLNTWLDLLNSPESAMEIRT